MGKVTALVSSPACGATSVFIGKANNNWELTESRIEVGRVTALVSSPACGATSVFIGKGLVTPGNGYVTEGKRTKMCRIWLSVDKIYLLCRSRLSRSVCVV